MEDLTKNKSTLMLIFYLVALYIEYPLYLMVVMSGLSKMDFYHVFLFFIFVAYTIWPDFFVKYSILLLIYADAFVISKYIWTLCTVTGKAKGWMYIIGLATSGYDPSETREYFRYSPKFD